jgi:hypothetical protein
MRKDKFCMARRVFAAAILLSLSTAAAAQQPVPLLPPPSSQTMPPPTIEQQIAPPAPPAADQPLLPAPASPAAAADRIFCQQNVPIRPADPMSVPEGYRPLLGIWSDAAWTPQLCAALIVETVAPDGTATMTYAYGPIGSGNRAPGGVLHGTGIVRDGELKFQNNDGSQYSFKPFYADLAGRLTTPQGQSYEAIFKKTY